MEIMNNHSSVTNPSCLSGSSNIVELDNLFEDLPSSVHESGNKVIILLDNSNLFYTLLRSSNAPGYGKRINYEMLLEFLVDGRVLVGSPTMYGSESEHGAMSQIASHAKKAGFHCLNFIAPKSQAEKCVDVALGTRLGEVKTILAMMKRFSQEGQHDAFRVRFDLSEYTVVLVSGDRDFMAPIIQLLNLGVNVEVCGLKNGMSGEYERLAESNERFHVRLLDEHIHCFSYDESAPTSPRIQPKAIVVQYHILPPALWRPVDDAICQQQDLKGCHVQPVSKDGDHAYSMRQMPIDSSNAILKSCRASVQEVLADVNTDKLRDELLNGDISHINVKDLVTTYYIYSNQQEHTPVQQSNSFEMLSGSEDDDGWTERSPVRRRKVHAPQSPQNPPHDPSLLCRHRKQCRRYYQYIHDKTKPCCGFWHSEEDWLYLKHKSTMPKHSRYAPCRHGDDCRREMTNTCLFWHKSDGPEAKYCVVCDEYGHFEEKDCLTKYYKLVHDRADTRCVSPCSTSSSCSSLFP